MGGCFSGQPTPPTNRRNPRRQQSHRSHAMPTQSYVVNSTQQQMNVAASSHYTMQSPIDPHSLAQPSITRQSFIGTDQEVYVALYSYNGRTTDDLSFEAGDHLMVLDNTRGAWWLAKHVNPRPGCQSEGFIPSNYVAPVNSNRAHSWFVGKYPRQKAERDLNAPGNPIGTFLIRESESTPGDFSLSVKDSDGVKHYRIRKLETGEYFISPRASFQSLEHLVYHYKFDADGLCCKLTEAIESGGVAPATEGLCHKDEWEIPRNQITLLREIGSGQFGCVYEGTWNNAHQVAVKQLKKGMMDSSDFLREAKIMKDLRHPNLIQLYAVVTISEPILIITELMVNGALNKYLQTPAGQLLSQKELIIMSEMIADGMKYLESKNYIHRDLAARNILVDGRNICKVADFGLARFLQGTDDYQPRDHQARLPIKWLAPEAAHYNRFSTKSDVWAFGVVLMEIITRGKVPYPGMSNAEVLEKIQTGYRMPRPQDCPEHLYGVMEECWMGEPDKRPTFETLKWRLEDGPGEADYREAEIFMR